MTEDDALTELKDLLPVDGDSARAPDTQLLRWLKEAAREISRRRAVDRAEITLTLVADQQTYTLPDDCVTVTEVIPVDSCAAGAGPGNLGVPSNVAMPMCVLPTGQAVTSSISMIRNQGLRRRRREFKWHLLEGVLVFDVPIREAGIARLLYQRENDAIDAVPDRYIDLMFLKPRYESLRLGTHRAHHIPVTDPDGSRVRQVQSMLALATTLEQQYEKKLSGIRAEVT